MRNKSNAFCMNLLVTFVTQDSFVPLKLKARKINRVCKSKRKFSLNLKLSFCLMQERKNDKTDFDSSMTSRRNFSFLQSLFSSCSLPADIPSIFA